MTSAKRVDARIAYVFSDNLAVYSVRGSACRYVLQVD